MTFVARLCGITLLVTGLAACAKTQAKMPAERPALQVPEVPPRVIEPSMVEEVQPEEPQQSPPATSTAGSRQTGRPRLKPETKEESGKSEPAASKSDANAESKPANNAPAQNLRTPQTANEAQAARKIREQLGQATRTLGTVNYAALNADARLQYDTAKRFIQQAEDALKVRNYVYASYLADKADTLARELSARK